MKRVHIVNCTNERIENAVKSAEQCNCQIIQHIGKAILEKRKNQEPINYDGIVRDFLNGEANENTNHS
jgi:RNA-binding protein YhbY